MSGRSKGAPNPAATSLTPPRNKEARAPLNQGAHALLLSAPRAGTSRGSGWVNSPNLVRNVISIPLKVICCSENWSRSGEGLRSRKNRIWHCPKSNTQRRSCLDERDRLPSWVGDPGRKSNRAWPSFTSGVTSSSLWGLQYLQYSMNGHPCPHADPAGA